MSAIVRFVLLIRLRFCKLKDFLALLCNRVSFFVFLQCSSSSTTGYSIVLPRWVTGPLILRHHPASLRAFHQPSRWGCCCMEQPGHGPLTGNGTLGLRKSHWCPIDHTCWENGSLNKLLVSSDICLKPNSWGQKVWVRLCCESWLWLSGSASNESPV